MASPFTMTLATIIQDRTNDGTSIVEFLFAVMRNELDDFKPCHRLDAAKLLVKYGKDEARNYILDYPPEPSQPRTYSSSPEDTHFDQKLAQVIQQSTDDGRKVCRFLINVMDGALSAFKPHHRISAARELLSRGFGKHAIYSRSGGGRNPEEVGRVDSHASNPDHRPTKSHKSPNQTNQSYVTPCSDTGSDSLTTNPEDEEEIPYDEIYAIFDAAKEESDRILAEQGIDPDNPPHNRTTPYSTSQRTTPTGGSKSGRTPSTPRSTRRSSRRPPKGSMPGSTLESNAESRSRPNASKERKTKPNERPNRPKPGPKLKRRKRRSPTRQRNWKTSALRHPEKSTSAGLPHPASRPHSGWSTADTPSASCTTDPSTTPRTTKAAPTTGTANSHPGSAATASDPTGVTNYRNISNTEYRAQQTC